MRRLVFDSNNWISLLLNPVFKQRIWDILDSGSVTLLLSKELIGEVRAAVAKKTYLRERISPQAVEDLIKKLRRHGKTIDVHSTVNICRDPKDNFLLALSQDGGADYLITGDDDLLALGAFGKTKIITLSEFEKE